MHNRRTTRWLQDFLSALAVCAVAGALVWPASAHAQRVNQPLSVRTLSGMVTDTSHEPIRGAIVELRNEQSNQVITYLTGADGRYTFKHLDGSVDYDVHVVFRGGHTRLRSISRFDDHMAKVINFKVRMY